MANSNRPYWWVRPHVSYPKDNSKWIAAREQWQQLGGDNPRTETGWKFALLPAILLACAAAAVYFGALHAIAEIGNAATPSDSLSYEAVPLSSYSSLGAEPASEAAAPAAGDPSRTYIDGEGFHRMMLLDSDAVEACNSAFETLSATNYQIDAAAAQALRASIDDVSARRDALPIDSSYREYSNQLGRMLLFGGQVVDASAAGASASQVNAYLEQFRSARDAARSELVTAMDANGVRYETGSDGGIRYWWLEY